MESSLRGYLLTGEEISLAPYQSSAAENEAIFKELDSLIISHTTQHEELTIIKEFHEKWKSDYANVLIEAKRNAALSDTASYAFRALYRKFRIEKTDSNLTSIIRERFKIFTNREYDMRELRKAKLDASVKNTNIISISLTSASIVIAAAIAFYILRIITSRITRMVDLADSISKGNFNPYLEDKNKDELGKLSNSLNIMSKVLEENISQLEKKNRELDNFAYVVSHDLKAPLRGIENIINWVDEDYLDKLPAEVKDYMLLIRGRIKRMENLIDGILDISRIGREKQKKESIDTKQLVDEIVELLCPRQGITIEINPLMPVVFSEKIPLQQVFTNLISNAIKYNPKEKGKVWIDCKEFENFYEFSVCDDGPGIESQYHGKIFQIFQTLKASNDSESTGVGLAIVKKVLEDKKASIRINSEKNKGAEFIFTWPK